MIALDDKTILGAFSEDAPEIVGTIERANNSRMKELLNKLVTRSQVAMVISGVNQRRINEATKHLETKVAEGLGEWVCRIDRLQYLAQQQIHGWNCWSDPEFIESFLRDNPGYRLRYHAKNYVNGWSGGSEDRGLRIEDGLETTGAAA